MRHLAVREIMSDGAICQAPPGTSVRAACRLMAEHQLDEYGYRHLPVVEAGALVGMVALRDCSIEDLAAMHAELETRRVVAERAW